MVGGADEPGETASALGHLIAWAQCARARGAGGVRLLKAELRGPYGRLPAVAVPALTNKRALAVARTADVDAVWQVASDVTILMADGEAPAGDDEDRSGPTLLELLKPHQASWPTAVKAWTTSSRPGWVQGGPLGIACDVCGAPLIWFDWRVAGADLRRSSWLVGCPGHGPSPRPRSSVPPLVQARRSSTAHCGSARPRRERSTATSSLCTAWSRTPCMSARQATLSLSGSSNTAPVRGRPRS